MRVLRSIFWGINKTLDQLASLGLWMLGIATTSYLLTFTYVDAYLSETIVEGAKESIKENSTLSAFLFWLLLAWIAIQLFVNIIESYKDDKVIRDCNGKPLTDRDGKPLMDN